MGIFRDGTGNIGRIHATTAPTTTITLANRLDINNFGVGQHIVSSLALGGALRSGAPEITAINRGDGTLTVGVNVATAYSWDVDDYLYVEGDAQNGTSNALQRMSGFAAWLPVTAPTAGDSFFGVDRSADVVRLAGNRIDADGMNIEEAFARMATEIAMQGGAADCVFCTHNVWEQLALELGSKKEYEDTEVGGFFFRALKMYSPDGNLNIYADRNCPAGYAYMLTKSGWSVDSVGDFPKILDLDNIGRLLREATDDAYELRVGGYPQVSNNAPGHNGVLYNLPTGN
jgi:hypothetical protein